MGSKRALWVAGWEQVLPKESFWADVTKYLLITCTSGAFLRCLILGLSSTHNTGGKWASSTKRMVLIMASTYWPIWFLQTTLLGIRLRLCVLSSIWRAGPCSQKLGHLKVTLPMPDSPVVFQGEWGGGRALCELASLSLCRLYLYSAVLFSPLMTVAISPGAFWGCFSNLYFWFWFFLGLTEDLQKQKQNRNRMHKVFGIQEVTESRSKKADVQDEGFGLRHSRLLWSPADVLMVYA